jgi:uncharacterized protein YgiM (DUF1202 family)
VHPLRWAAALLVLCILATAPVRGEEVNLRIQVAEPYVDLHTGPGRGYPVAQVVERGEWVDILFRRTDWFQVRTLRGKEGWVSRADIENMTTETGERFQLRDVLYEDYRNRRFEVGFAGGMLEGDTFMMARAGYRLNENLTGEFTVGQSSGDFSSSLLYYGAVLSEPFPEWRVSPFFSLGLGRFNNTPKATLVGAMKTESNTANVAIGARAYLTRRFVVRGDYRRHLVFIDENRINEYNEVSLGFSIFFY